MGTLTKDREIIVNMEGTIDGEVLLQQEKGLLVVNVPVYIKGKKAVCAKFLGDNALKLAQDAKRFGNKGKGSTYFFTGCMFGERLMHFQVKDFH